MLYRVFPLPPVRQVFSPIKEPPLKFEAGVPIGCASFVVVCVIIAICLSVFESLFHFRIQGLRIDGVTGSIAWIFFYFVFPSLAAIGIAVVSMSLIRRSQMARLNEEHALFVEQSAECARLAADNEANACSAKLNDILAASERLAAQSPEVLKRVARCIEMAKCEYSESAYGPFWDAIEEAVSGLAQFEQSCRQVTANANKYYDGLRSRQHNFPPFVVKAEFLGNPRSLVDELRGVVRLGQTQKDFAVIWEHRKTREVLLRGFRTLSDALIELEVGITDALMNLEGTVASGIETQAVEIAATRALVDERTETQITLAGEQGETLSKILEAQKRSGKR